MLSEALDVASASAFMQASFAVIAILGLWLGAEAASRFASALAVKLGLSTLIIGLTLVSVASSLPEIFVNVAAAWKGDDNVAAGNVVGSCFVQIAFVLGLCAIIARELKIERHELARDGTMVVAANVAMLAVILDGRISIIEGVTLVIAYAAYMAWLISTVMQQTTGAQSAPARTNDPDTSVTESGWFYAVATFGSVFLVWAMADVLVAIGKSAGEAAGLSDGLIGLWVGVGTTFPELVISVAAILRGASGLSLGNLLGSNVTDPLLSLGIGVIAGSGLLVTGFITVATLVWLAATLLAIGALAVFGQLRRSSGIALIAAYVVGQTYLIQIQAL